MRRKELVDRVIYTVDSVNKNYLNDTIGKLEEQVSREVRWYFERR